MVVCLFVTLVNTTDKKISILELNLTKEILGVVIGKSTSLMWQDLYATPYNYFYGTHSNALYYCRALSLASYTDWRVPKVNELEEMYNTGLVNKFIYKPGSEKWSNTFSHTNNGWGGAMWYFK